jgi:phage terminase large subunit GpA-like protein
MRDPETLLGGVLELAAPPAREPLSDWADANRRLSSEASAAPGEWRTLPFQKEPLDAIAPGSPYETVVLVWASQLGKSELWLNLLAYIIAVEPGPTLICLPTLSMAEAFSKDRLSPLFRDMPILKGKVADAKAKSGDATLFHRRFTGGHLTLVGSNSAAGLASRPIRYLLLDEVDRFEESAGMEGDAVSLALARTRTFWNRKVIMTSSPTVKGASRIEQAWLQSDMREFEVPCANCNDIVALQWDRIEWPPSKPEEAAWRCPACGELIPHHLKDSMVDRGRWRATNVGNSQHVGNSQPSRIAGFHLSELVSPWRSWAALAEDWERSKDAPEMRRVFVNTSLAEWTADEVTEPPEAAALAARCEPFAAEVPAPVSLITAGADLQHDRAEVEIVGWSKGFESWSIAYHTVYGDPSGPHLWQQLDALLSREWKHESGMPLRINAACVDCGFLPDEVHAFTRPRFSRRIYSVKGLNNGWSKPIWPRKPVYSSKQLPMFLISVDEAKQWFFRRLTVTEGAGRCHFPIGRPLDWFRMLTAETLVRRTRAGRAVYEWQNLRRERNEALDARVYAIAALHSLLMAGLNLDAHAASFEAMLKPGLVDGLPSPPAPQRIYSKFVWG